jgi:hypothetical protein
VLLLRYNPGYMRTASHQALAAADQVVEAAEQDEFLAELSDEQREVLRQPSLARASSGYTLPKL